MAAGLDKKWKGQREGEYGEQSDWEWFIKTEQGAVSQTVRHNSIETETLSESSAKKTLQSNIW